MDVKGVLWRNEGVRVNGEGVRLDPWGIEMGNLEVIIVVCSSQENHTG